MSMEQDDLEVARVGRHSLQSEVRAGGGPAEILPDERDHIRVEVDIEVGGADGDRPHTYRLLEAIEDAVQDTVEDYGHPVDAPEDDD